MMMSSYRSLLSQTKLCVTALLMYLMETAVEGLPTLLPASGLGYIFTTTTCPSYFLARSQVLQAAAIGCLKETWVRVSWAAIPIKHLYLRHSFI